MRKWLLALALLAPLAPPAAAQQSDKSIALAPGKPYVHKPTGFTIPATLDGIPRQNAQSLADNQLDDYVNFYNDADDNISVYIFRHVTGSVPVWFDRVQWQVEHRADRYGTVVPLAAAAPFVPPGQQNATGLIRVWVPGKGPYRSTGVAFMPLGPDWYVAIRYTARTLDAETLRTRLDTVAAALGWPKKIAPQPDALPVIDCVTTISVDAEGKPVKPEGTDALAVLFAIPVDKKTDKPAAPVTWCRDAALTADVGKHGIYRPDGAADSYLLALEDAGRGVMVAPNPVAPKNGKTHWLVTHVEIDHVTLYPPFEHLPSPARAVDAINNGHSISSAATWGKSVININSDALK